MSIIEQIIQKHQADRSVIKEMKKRHAEELRVVEEYQSKREDALLERAGIEAFGYMTDLFINGRDGKAEAKKEEANIALNQSKIEAWLLKMLSQVGEGIRTEFGTVYKTRKESVSVADFDMFVDNCMLEDAAKAVASDLGCDLDDLELLRLIKQTIHQNMHIELLNKAVNKTAILELMGAPEKDGSRPNTPPAGINYVALQTVGVRKK